MAETPEQLDAYPVWYAECSCGEDIAVPDLDPGASWETACPSCSKPLKIVRPD